MGGKSKGPTPRKRKVVPTVFLAYVRPRSPGLVHHDWAESIWTTAAYAAGKVRLRPLGIATGPLLSRARNQLVKLFLEKNDEYLLFTDTDITFRWEDLRLLLEVCSGPRAIVGGVYFALDGNGERCVAHLVELEGEPGVYTDVPIERLYREVLPGRHEPADPFEVSGLGMGFTLIKREVMEALADVRGGIKGLWPFAETENEESGRGNGEDLTFCLRAKELGYSSFVVPEVKVGHIKEIEL